jgi:hypothetical protein
MGRVRQFVVRLPLAPPAAAEVAPSNIDRRNARRRVLVVDDDVDGADELAAVVAVEMLGHAPRWPTPLEAFVEVEVRGAPAPSRLNVPRMVASCSA